MSMMGCEDIQVPSLIQPIVENAGEGHAMKHLEGALHIDIHA